MTRTFGIYHLVAFCLRATQIVAITRTLDISKGPHLTDHDSGKSITWNYGEIAELQRTSIAIRVHSRGLFFIPRSYTISESALMQRESTACLPCSKGLCCLPGSNSVVFPNEDHVPTILYGANVSLNGLENVLQKVASRNCINPGNGVGREITNKIIYDISLCDLIESNIDIIVVGDQLYIGTNETPIYVYAVLSIVVLYMIVVLSENISTLIEIRLKAATISINNNTNVSTQCAFSLNDQYKLPTNKQTTLKQDTHSLTDKIPSRFKRVTESLSKHAPVLLVFLSTMLIVFLETPHLYMITNEEYTITVYMYAHIIAAFIRYCFYVTRIVRGDLLRNGDTTFTQYNILLINIILVLGSLYSTLEIPYSLGILFLLVSRFMNKIYYNERTLKSINSIPDDTERWYAIQENTLNVVYCFLDVLLISMIFYASMRPSMLRTNDEITPILYFIVLVLASAIASEVITGTGNIGQSHEKGK